MSKRKYEHRGMITRTITTTTGEVLFFNSETKSTEKATVTINGEHTPETFLKKAKVNGVALVVENVTVNKTLYGMDMAAFMEHAQVIE